MNNIFYICNALDDVTRFERGIVTDSPAASRKIFLLCRAIRKAGVRAVVISMGRGRQDGTGRYFRSKICRVNGIPVIYLPFLHVPILSELLSLFSFIPVLWRIRSINGDKAALFYNQFSGYILALVMARALQFRTVLDLEDGDVNLTKWSFGWGKSLVVGWIFDTLCSGGALLACSALESNTRLRPTQCCYGIDEASGPLSKQSLFPVSVLFGGTVSFDTGSPLLIDAIKILREDASPLATKIRFEISGKGDCLCQFQELANDIREPAVIVHGRLTDDEYQNVLARTQVGLALKPNSGVFAHTTFPSKVIEFASHGILIVSTDISDVRKVFADGAIYLTEDNSRHLIEKLRWIVENREEAKSLTLKGEQTVGALCAPETVGQTLVNFVFNTSRVLGK